MAVRINIDSLLAVARTNDDTESACRRAFEVWHEADGDEGAKKEHKEHQAAKPLAPLIRSSGVPSGLHRDPGEQYRRFQRAGGLRLTGS